MQPRKQDSGQKLESQEAKALRPSDLAAGDRGLVGAGGMGVRVGGCSASWPRTAALDETLARYTGPHHPWQNNARPLWPPRLPSAAVDRVGGSKGGGEEDTEGEREREREVGRRCV